MFLYINIIYFYVLDKKRSKKMQKPKFAIEFINIIVILNVLLYENK